MSILFLLVLFFGTATGTFKPAYEFEVKQGAVLNNGRSYTISEVGKSAVKEASPHYTIQNEFFNLGKKLILLENGQPLYEIKHKLGHLYQKWNIYNAKTGDTIGTLKHRPSVLHDSYKFKSPKFGNYRITGNIGGRTFSIKQNGHKVAEIHKKRFHLHDTYSLEIEANQNPGLMLLLTIGIDEIRQH